MVCTEMEPAVFEHTVKIPGRYTWDNHSQYLQQLQAQGLVQGQDYEWSYYPETWDGFSQSEPAHTCVVFRDPTLAMFYQLKWQ